jgi:hypothetical protein
MPLQGYHRDSIRKYRDSGQIWVARDIAVGLISHVRYDEELFGLAAEIHRDMGDLPRAGLYWMMTTDRSAEAEDAVNAAIAHYGKSLGTHIRLYVRPNVLPTSVRSRLEDALARAGTLSLEELHQRTRGHPEGVKNKVFAWGCGVAVAFILFTFFIGLGTIVWWIF